MNHLPTIIFSEKNVSFRGSTLYLQKNRWTSTKIPVIPPKKCKKVASSTQPQWSGNIIRLWIMIAWWNMQRWTFSDQNDGLLEGWVSKDKLLATFSMGSGTCWRCFLSTCDVDPRQKSHVLGFFVQVCNVVYALRWWWVVVIVAVVVNDSLWHIPALQSVS